MKVVSWIAVGILIIGIGLIANPLYMLAKAHFAQLLLANAWQRSQLEGGHHKPWPWADTHPMAKLTINKDSFIVLSGMTGRTMAFGPGWLQASAAPNKPGNTILSAHNDTHFAPLESLRVGDLLTLEGRDKVEVAYRVTEIHIVPATSDNWFESNDRRQLTLITCYPFEATPGPKTQRLLVTALASP